MNADATESNELRDAKLGVLAAITDGDAGLAFDIVNGLLAEGYGFEAVLFDVIAPLQREIGERWHQGDFGVSEEHAATGAVETVVALLAGSMEMPADAPHVVVACAEDDTHSLPARMIAAYLTYVGWRVTFLGASIPANDLGIYLADAKPEAVVLSCAIVTRLPGARAAIRAAHGAGIPVLAGGRGFGENGSRAAALGADAWAATPADADLILRTWQPSTSESETGAMNPDAEFEALDAHRYEILKTVTGALAEELGSDGTRLRNHGNLSLLFEATRAAVLMKEPGIVNELATWHREQRSTDNLADATPVVLHALRDAVAPYAPTAAAYLDNAA